MFMTSPHFQVRVPKSLLPTGGTCSQAVTLSSNASWYVLTTRHAVGSAVLRNTTLVAWPQTLRAMLEGAEDGAVISIQWMRPTCSLKGWQLIDVGEVWLAAEHEEPQTGPLLIRPATEAALLDEQGEEVSPSRASGRTLLMSFGGQLGQ